MTAPARILGWDLLRGLCALAVMAYHLMGWQELAHVSTLGTYGVYLFFTLSGASLAYVYDRQALSGAGIGRFLALRWLRLAPLYLMVSVLWLAMLAAHQGAWADRLPLRLLLNASFAFGLRDPTVWALPVGGWSLGIEAMFYLALPLIVRLLRRPAWRWGLLLATAGLQAGWIAGTVGRDGLAEAIVRYQQVPGFAAYFVAGCLIGRWQRGRVADLPASAGAALWGLLAAVLLATAPAVAGNELLGWRGLLLPAACTVAVWLSGRVRLHGGAGRLAVRLGDLTYGVYLLHPVVHFGWAWFGPGWMLERASAQPGWAWCMVALEGMGTVALAAWVHRAVEQPVARWRRVVMAPSRARPGGLAPQTNSQD